MVRHILNLAADEWLDENASTWLHRAPKIKLLPVHDARKAYALSWEVKAKSFTILTNHLCHMASFKVNTGNCEHEVYQLRWQWEVVIPDLSTSVFVVPGSLRQSKRVACVQEVKRMVENGEDRLILLNQTARNVVIKCVVNILSLFLPIAGSR